MSTPEKAPRPPPRPSGAAAPPRPITAKQPIASPSAAPAILVGSSGANGGPAEAPAIEASEAPAIDVAPVEAPRATPMPLAPVAPIAPVEMGSAIPRISDPELRAAAASIAHAVQGRDPEASLDIPPPADVTPPEEREPDAKDPYIGTTFDHRYKIERLLGEGGMGFVYLARHKVIDKKVAVKVLRADLARDREILDRFLQEAKAASSIGNPHIVDISDFGDLPDGSTYFVMEFLEGQSLSQIMDGGDRLSVERIAHIATQIADGLSAAHAQGIVHRDLKPDNIFCIGRGADHDFVKILDFGIAKVSGNASTKLTKAGAVFGTPHYMSPEQAAGAPVDHRTDIYALGVILYEMVSGQLPFNADNFMGILTQHMYKAPVPIRALVPGPECPPSLEAVILKCLSKKPESRYPSMDELAADLERVRTGQVANAVSEMMARSGGFNVPADYFKQPNMMVPATPPAPTKKWARLVWIAGAAAAVGIVGIIFVISGTTAGTTPPASSTTAASSTSAAPSAAAVTAAPSATEAPTAASSAAAVKKIPVAITAFPDIAQVFRDGVLVGRVPVAVEVEEGKSVTIEIKADGFATETLTLDGKETGKNVKLRYAGRPGGKPLGKPAAKKGGKTGDVIDPWK
jgi:eukaryotic-like serine/threonine-protein kinase